jgi:hypothetical protein
MLKEKVELIGIIVCLRFRVFEAGCDAEWTCRWVLAFRGNVSPPFSGVSFLRNFGYRLQDRAASQPRRILPPLTEPVCSSLKYRCVEVSSPARPLSAHVLTNFFVQLAV